MFETWCIKIEARERPGDVGAGHSSEPGGKPRDEQGRGGIVTERRRSGGDLVEAGAVYAARRKTTIERLDPERQNRPALALYLRKLRAKLA